jgi:hypothetical protein
MYDLRLTIYDWRLFHDVTGQTRIRGDWERGTKDVMEEFGIGEGEYAVWEVRETWRGRMMSGVGERRRRG